MSQIVTSASEIPSARFYVLANDSFMSGWGLAQGRINTVIVPCETFDEANHVENHLLFQRGEMKRVRVTGAKPRLRPHIVYSLFSRDDASSWFPQAAK